MSLMSFCSRLLEASACESPWVEGGGAVVLLLDIYLEASGETVAGRSFKGRLRRSDDDLHACSFVAKLLRNEANFSFAPIFFFTRFVFRHTALEMGPLRCHKGQLLAVPSFYAFLQTYVKFNI